MERSQQLFLALVEQVEPDEVIVAIPMLDAHVAGHASDETAPSAVGFGVGGVLITPALLTALSSVAVIALPLLRGLVEIVVPSISAAADVTSIRDTIKKSATSAPGLVIDNIPKMAHQLEEELVKAGFETDRSREVSLTCVKALLSDPATASELLSQLDRN